MPYPKDLPRVTNARCRACGCHDPLVRAMFWQWSDMPLCPACKERVRALLPQYGIVPTHGMYPPGTREVITELVDGWTAERKERERRARIAAAIEL